MRSARRAALILLAALSAAQAEVSLVTLPTPAIALTNSASPSSALPDAAEPLAQAATPASPAAGVGGPILAPSVNPVPEAALAAVPVRRVVRPGFAVPGTPTDLNASITVRYGPARPRAVLLLMPGFLGGAGSFDRLARQIAALSPGVAVWAVDRRSNLLEPQAELAAASTEQLTQIAQRGLPARSPQSLAFMSDWGLDTTLRDWRVAVLEARSLTPNVFLGGHSLGASMAGLYAAYDFGSPGSGGGAGGAGSGARGYQDVRGLVMLDGVPALLGDLLGGPPMTRQTYQTGISNLLGRVPGLNGLKANPYVTLQFFGPTFASRAAAQARLTAQNPSAASPVGGMSTYPTTNLACAMLQMEGRYAILPFLSITTGRATNANEGPNLLARALGSRSAMEVSGPADLRQPVGWQADPQAPTDPLDFARRFWTPQSDYVEWYFPNRLLLDVAAASTDTRTTPFERDLRVWYTRSVTTPILDIAAGNGLTRESDYARYASQTQAAMTTHTLPGAAHMDITAARSDQVARWVLNWMRPLAR